MAEAWSFFVVMTGEINQMVLIPTERKDKRKRSAVRDRGSRSSARER